MTSHLARFLVRRPDRSRRVLDPSDVYLLEADRDDTLVRLRRREPLRDVRSLSEIEPVLEPHGFFRIHESWVVNLARIREIRPREERDWEVVLDPPVNRVLPVARGKLRELFAALEEPGSR